MEIYFLFIAFLFVLSLVEVFEYQPKNKNNANLLFGVYIVSVVIIGLRWETGTDWIPYVDMFRQSYSLQNSFEYSIIVEKGYLIMNWISYKIANSYSVFLFFHASIFYFLILLGLRKITLYPITSYLYFFCSTVGVIGSNRQLLAAGIVFFFLTTAFDRKKSFFIAVFAAIQFHTTALLSASFFFHNRRFKTIHLLAILFVAGAIGLTGLPGKVFSFAGGLSEGAAHRTEVYAAGGSENAGLSVFGVIRRVAYFGLFLIIRDKVEKKYKPYNFLLNGYSVSIIIYLMFASSLVILVNRGSLYFNMLEGVLLSSVLLLLDKSDSKFLFLLAFAALSILSMYQSMSAYPDLFDPYKAIWYNVDYFRRMH